MNFVHEYRHKKFDSKRILPNITSTPMRKRSWSYGSDCSSQMSSSETDSIDMQLNKCPKLIDEPANDSGISVTSIGIDNVTKVPAIILPTTALDKLPNIKEETLARIYKYHGNMVRKFPQKQRTPRDQERRDKNTLACRQSRFIKKLHCVLVEEKYKNYTEQYHNIIEETMRTKYYMQQLLKMSKSNDKTSNIKPEPVEGAMPMKKSFTIAYLLKSH